MGAERNSKLIARRDRIVPKGVGRFAAPLTVAKAKGAVLTDEDGREFIDLASGIGVTGAGHCDPTVVAAIKDQAERLLHTCIHVGTYEPYIALCERLAALFPHGNTTCPDTKVFLCNTGAEAVENAVKIARQATKRSAVICFSEAFHGRTMMAMTLTSKVGYKTNCGPFAPEVYRFPFPNIFKYGGGMNEKDFVRQSLTRLRQAFSTSVPAEQVAAIIIEPVQGEGGFVPAPVEFMKGLRAICNEFGIMLIADEVQTGFGRTGSMAAYTHSGIVPDLSTWAKSLGGGLPIAAVVGRADIMDAAGPSTLGGTYGGNPVSCAAALANIAVIEKLGLCERAKSIGRKITTSFRDLQRQCPHVGDIRGVGAMIAMELCENGAPDRPLTQVTTDIVKGCYDKGVLLVTAGIYGNVIRVLCPLVITDQQLDQALEVIRTEAVRAARSVAAA